MQIHGAELYATRQFLFAAPTPFPPSSPCWLFFVLQMAPSATCSTAICVSVSVWWCAGVYLEASIVKAAFEYSLREDVSLCGFLGDDCITMKHTPEIQVQYCQQLERYIGLGAVKLVLFHAPLEV